MEDRPDKITRVFTVPRPSGYNTEYAMTTYSYIFSETKTDNKNYELLRAYMREVFLEGTPEKGTKKSVSKESNIVTSKKRFMISEDIHPEIIDLAKKSKYEGKGKDQHLTVQEFFLRNDPYTIGYEIPVWDDDYHTHIDLVRVHPSGLVEVLDFKPAANLETTAAAQIFKCTLLLSERTGISMQHIAAWYFDNRDAFLVTL